MLSKALVKLMEWVTTVTSIRLLHRYSYTAIKEHKDTDTMRLDELIGSLRTYEINDGFLKNDNLKGVALKAEKSKPISSKKEKSKVVAYKVEVLEHPDEGQTNGDELDDDDIIMMMVKKFGNMMKRRSKWSNKRPPSGKKYVSTSSSKNFNKSSFDKSADSNMDKLKCRFCDGWGHIRGSDQLF